MELIVILLGAVVGWNAIELEYNRLNPLRPRDVDALRIKFKSLRNVQKPTGDPTCPPEVVRAKRAQANMEAKQSVVTMDDDEDEEDEEEVEEEDEVEERIRANEQQEDNEYGFASAAYPEEYDEALGPSMNPQP
jgi:hypothetical protein